MSCNKCYTKYSTKCCCVFNETLQLPKFTSIGGDNNVLTNLPFPVNNSVIITDTSSGQFNVKTTPILINGSDITGVGTLDVDILNAGTFNPSNITTTTLTADDISANEITVDTLNATTFNPSTINTTTLTANDISANEITVDTLNATTINGTVSNATTATNFTGSLVGDVTGTQSSTVVSTVGGQSAVNVASGVVLANASTNLNTVSTIVRRDASGNFSAGTITASLTGAASLNVLKAGDTMTGPLVLPQGLVGTPSLSFTGSTTSGLYSPSANTVNLSIAGVSKLTATTSGIVNSSNYKLSYYRDVSPQTLVSTTEVIQYNLLAFDDNSSYNIGTSTFTVPLSATYSIVCQTSFLAPNTPDVVRTVQVNVGGIPVTGYSTSSSAISAIATTSLNMAVLMKLVANDAITITFSGVVGDIIQMFSTNMGIYLVAI